MNSSGFLLDQEKLSWTDILQGFSEFWNERKVACEFVLTYQQQHDRYGVPKQVPLEAEVLVNGNECVEVPFCKLKQFSICFSGPATLVTVVTSCSGKNVASF